MGPSNCPGLSFLVRQLYSKQQGPPTACGPTFFLEFGACPARLQEKEENGGTRHISLARLGQGIHLSCPHFRGPDSVIWDMYLPRRLVKVI